MKSQVRNDQLDELKEIADAINEQMRQLEQEYK